MAPPRFFGKYRGKVEMNIDPFGQGRLQVSVPAVLGGARMAWAMPCSPYAGPGVGLFMIPPVGAQVWVEFEGGDPDFPIWAGGFWGTGEAPSPAPGPQQVASKMLKTDAVALTVNDLPGAGGVTLEVNPPAVAMPAKIEITSAGITISMAAAKIELTAAGVAINGDALRVLP
jgi:Type VI secretion system/phage-baseplate injector OB domain